MFPNLLDPGGTTGAGVGAGPPTVLAPAAEVRCEHLVRLAVVLANPAGRNCVRCPVGLQRNVAQSFSYLVVPAHTVGRVVGPHAHGLGVD